MKYVKLFENWIDDINEGLPKISKVNPDMRKNVLKSYLSQFDEYQKKIQQSTELLLHANPSSNARIYYDENINYYRDFISVVINTIQRLRGKYQVGNSVSPMAWHDMFDDAKKIPLSIGWIKAFISDGRHFSWGKATYEKNLAELLGHYFYMRICGINIMKNIIHSMIDNNTEDMLFQSENFIFQNEYKKLMDCGAGYFPIELEALKYKPYDIFSSEAIFETGYQQDMISKYIDSMNLVSTRINQLNREASEIYNISKNPTQYEDSDRNKLCAIFFISEYYGAIASIILNKINEE